MANPLHEQLLKAGLVKKSKVAAAAREQNQQRKAKAPAAPTDTVDARQLQVDRAERDRALAAEQKAQQQQHEQRAQIRQIIETKRVPHGGDIAYRFVDAGAMQTIYVDAALRAQLAKGALVIVPFGGGYALLPRAAVAQIRERGGHVALDHGGTTPATSTPAADSDDEHYAKFKVPDDLIW